MNKQSEIDFWGIGAQKCGTSWLYYNLNKLSEFTLPPLKELHYFDRSTNYPSPSALNEILFRKEQVLPILKKGVKSILLSVKNRNKNDALFFYKWYFSNYSFDHAPIQNEDDWQKMITETLNNAKSFINYGFNTIGLCKMIGLVFPENTASINVLSKWSHLYEKEIWSMEMWFNNIVYPKNN